MLVGEDYQVSSPEERVLKGDATTYSGAFIEFAVTCLPFKVIEPTLEIKNEASEEVKEEEKAEVSAFVEENTEEVEEVKEESKTKREKFDVRMCIKTACVSVAE